MNISEEELETLLDHNPDLEQANRGIKILASQKDRLNFDSVKPRQQSFTSEKDFQEWFRKKALSYGYLFYHTHRSQFSPSGFPDDVLVRLEPEPRLIFAELKTDDLKNSQPSIDQWMWLYILQHIPFVECYLFRPSDSDGIVEILRYNQEKIKEMENAR